MAKERVGLACSKCGGISWDLPLDDYCKCVTHKGGLADLIPSIRGHHDNSVIENDYGEITKGGQ